MNTNFDITLICVGKIKEKYYREAVGEFEKRLGRYCKLNIIEVEDEKAPDKAGEAENERSREREARRILKHIKADAYLITLEILGKMYSSKELAGYLEKLSVEGVNSLQFVIGGSLGLHNSVCGRADLRLSFSKMTFPHQLMRVILLEQIYRSLKIINKEPYHK